MKYLLKIEVSLKSGHSDPEGETTNKLLKELGYNVDSVDVSKLYTIQLNAKNLKDAKLKAEEMCNRLLANPTKDNYSILIEEQE
ncbi:phosphoribosylformylglycinamidine synthase, purS protein [Candidatus Bathyarchaeota archaeon]|nr:phosphoribosylformylglycinamidine synthase, purS protein [Candidatus Bathyarchaeota archaeon]